MHSGALLNIWRWEFDNRRQLLDTSSGARSFVYQALATFRSLVFQTLFWQSESGGEHHLIQENLRCPSGSFKVPVIHLVCLRMEEFTRIFCEIRQKLQKLNFHVHSLSISELSSASFTDLLHDHVDIFHWKSGVILYFIYRPHTCVWKQRVIQYLDYDQRRLAQIERNWWTRWHDHVHYGAPECPNNMRFLKRVDRISGAQRYWTF